MNNSQFMISTAKIHFFLHINAKLVQKEKIFEL